MFKKYLLISVSSLSLSTSLFAMDSPSDSKNKTKIFRKKLEKGGVQWRSDIEKKRARLDNKYSSLITFPQNYLNNPKAYLGSLTDEELEGMNLKEPGCIAKLLEESAHYKESNHTTLISLLAFYVYTSSILVDVEKWQKEGDSSGASEGPNYVKVLKFIRENTYSEFNKRKEAYKNLKDQEKYGESYIPTLFQESIGVQFYFGLHSKFSEMRNQEEIRTSKSGDVIFKNLILSLEWVGQCLDPLEMFFVRYAEKTDGRIFFNADKAVFELKARARGIQDRYSQLEHYLTCHPLQSSNAQESILLKLTNNNNRMDDVIKVISKKSLDRDQLFSQTMVVLTRINFFLRTNPFTLINSLDEDTPPVSLGEEELKALDEQFSQFQMKELQRKAQEGQEARKKEEETRKKEEEIRKAKQAEFDKKNKLLFEEYDKNKKRGKGKGKSANKVRGENIVSLAPSISLSPVIAEENALSSKPLDNVLEEKLPQPILPSYTAELTIESQKETISQIEDQQVDEIVLEEKKLIVKQAIESILSLPETNQSLVIRNKLESYLYTLEYQDDTAMLETIDEHIDELHCKILSQRESIKDTTEGRVTSLFIRDYINNVMNISAKYLKFSGIEAKYLVEALGGECDKTRSGSRIAYKLRDAQGHEHVRSIHLHNITSILDGGRLSSFRDLLISAGYY